MPGPGSGSKPLQLVGVAAAVVAAVGYAALGWRFGGDVDVVPATIAVACVALAVGATLYRRFG